MSLNILFLDGEKTRAVHKALAKHGTVYHAPDVNQALTLMVENDFDYYFVDADTAQAQAFLGHLEHDPHVVTPKAVVLLTDNREEDCSAWRVDTFITRERITRDLPYIFSHLKGEAPEPTKVLTIVPGDQEDAAEPAGRLWAFGERSADGDDTRERRSRSGGETRRLEREPERAGARLEPKEMIIVAGRGRAGRFMLLAVASLVAAAALWLFAWGPFSTRQSPDGARSGSTKTVEAESSSAELEQSAPRSEKKEPAVEAVTSGDVEGAVIDSGVLSGPELTPEPVPAETPAAPAESPNPPIVPAVAENRAPGVSISGPTQVMARQTATYTAVGSDPDGDGLTYSWGGSTTSRCWSTPGLYTVSVTVTDSRGAAGSAVMNVRVI